MPANPSKGGRDNYPTPMEYASWTARRAEQLRGEAPLAGDELNVLEPGCGAFAPFAGAMLGSSMYPTHAVGVEIDNPKIEAGPGVVVHAGTDVLDSSLHQRYTPPVATKYGWDMILTNPPFSIAEEIIRSSLDRLHGNGVAAFLLRLAFLETKKRMDFFRELPPKEVAILVRRPSFDGVGTDYSAYGVFFWVGDRLKERLDSPTTQLYWVDNTALKVHNMRSFGMPGAC